MLDLTGITLNDELYKLAREKVVQDVLGPTARSWQMQRLPVTTKREPRSNVRRGEIDGEWVITYDDWSKGVTGDHRPIPGTIYCCDNVDPSTPGSLKQLGGADYITPSSPERAPCKVVQFGGFAFVVNGRYVYKCDGPTPTSDKDFGAGVLATDAAIHDNYLVVGFGGSTTKIQKRDTAGNWTQASDAVYADYFGKVETNLWRATATNEVSNIASTDDPFTLANWSTGIPIGDDDVPITDLNGSGERLAVSKEDGLYLGDAGAVFPNVLQQVEGVQDADNGRNTFATGSIILYPCRNGTIWLYENGGATDVSISNQLTSVEEGALNDNVPGFQVTAFASQGKYIWAAADPLWYKRYDVTGFLKTVDNEANYTDYTTEATDNNNSTVAVLDSLDTAANGDYFYVGHSSKFTAVYLFLSAPNATTSVLTGEVWTGAAWVAMTGATAIHDQTSVGGATLARSGVVSWHTAHASWAQKDIDGTTDYWIRFSVSAAIDTEVEVSECRVIDNFNATFYRGRPRRNDDVFDQRIIWEPFFYEVAHDIRAMLVVGSEFKDYALGGTLIWSDRHTMRFQRLAVGNLIPPHATQSAGNVYFYKDDAGMPEINKEWLSIVTKGKDINATNTISLYHRCNEATTWTLDESSTIVSSPYTTSLSSITGYSIQLRYVFNQVLGDTPTEINEVEVVFREILTTYKNEYTVMLEIADGLIGSEGESLPDAKRMLTNMETAQEAGTITLIDPVGESKSVNIQEFGIVEKTQEAMEYPALLAKVRMTEV